MRITTTALGTFAALLATMNGARAQSGFSNWSYGPYLSANEVPLTRTATNANDVVRVAVLANGGGTATAGSLPLGAFASARDILATNQALGRSRGLMLQGIAMASAFNIAPPNPGDRFSLNFGTASYLGEVAGSFSLAYRVTPQAMLYGGIAQGAGQSVLKGGLSISLQ